MPEGEYVLYRFFNQEGQLLYIGQSVNVWRRFKQHRRSTFYPEAETVTLQRGFTNADELTEAEATAIKTEHPRYNIIHNTSSTVRSPVPYPRYRFSPNAADTPNALITQAEFSMWWSKMRELSKPERDLLHAIGNRLDRGWSLDRAYKAAIQRFVDRYGTQSAANIRPTIPPRQQWKSEAMTI